MPDEERPAWRPAATFALVWSYRPRPGSEADFTAEYGSEGSWAGLFRRSSDYRGTELLEPAEPSAPYLVIDRWKDAPGHARFLEEFGADYEALGRRLSSLWVEERRLGSFELRDSPVGGAARPAGGSGVYPDSASKSRS
jgi:hypothetical protein